VKIMVVDDECLIVDGLVKMLGSIPGYRHEIQAAYDGIDALERMETFTPDLLITDIRMPGMDGLALIQATKDIGKCQFFLVLTGHSEFDYARQAIKCHVEDYLLKPINYEELVRIVQNIAVRLSGAEHLEKLSLPPIGILQFVEDIAKCSPVVRKAVRYIDDNYANKVYRESIARYVAVNPNYLCTLFQKELGITVLQFIDYTRLRKAAELLLKDKDMPMKAISEEVGFVNSNVFFRVFKKRIGITPRQFKDQFSAWVSQA
jgi:two-component system, response regulator YesN